MQPNAICQMVYHVGFSSDSLDCGGDSRLGPQSGSGFCKPQVGGSIPLASSTIPADIPTSSELSAPLFCPLNSVGVTENVQADETMIEDLPQRSDS